MTSGIVQGVAVKEPLAAGTAPGQGRALSRALRTRRVVEFESPSGELAAGLDRAEK